MIPVKIKRWAINHLTSVWYSLHSQLTAVKVVSVFLKKI